MFNGLRWELSVCSDDIVGMFDYHCLMSLFGTEWRPKANYICAIHMLCEVWFFTHILISLGEEKGGVHRTSLTPPPFFILLLMYLYQVRKVSCRVFLWLRYQLCLFLRFFFSIFEMFSVFHFAINFLCSQLVAYFYIKNVCFPQVQGCTCWLQGGRSKWSTSESIWRKSN